MSFPTENVPCPICGFVNNAVTGPDTDPPKPGDVAICAQCIEPSFFDEQLRPRKPTLRESAEMADDPFIRKAQYATQITAMIIRGKNWLKEHPGQDVKIQFNIPPKVGLIQAISEAVKTHSVSTTPAGLELLKALWEWDTVKEPTVIMCRVAIEFITKGAANG